MNVEKVDGSTVFTELFKEEEQGQERVWNFLIRSDGSISLYFTVEPHYGHNVVWDSADNEPMGSYATKKLHKLVALQTELLAVATGIAHLGAKTTGLR